jgi:hypothetical protein
VGLWAVRVGVPSRRTTSLERSLAGPRDRPLLPDRERAERIAEIVDWTSFRLLPWVGSCLPRALVLQGLLVREGIDARLAVGVRRTTGPFQAHAWVECGGQPVREEESVATAYAPLPWPDLRAVGP